MTRHPGIPLVLAAVLAAACCSAAEAQGLDDEKSAKVKAAFLVNFAKFSEWPPACFNDVEGTRAPLVIAVVGEDRHGVSESLAAMVRDKPIHDRPVVVRHLAWPDDGVRGPTDREFESLLEQLEGGHLVYIDSSLQDRIPGLLNRLGDTVLTVSDSAGFAARGGMIGFVVQGGRVAFEANTDAIDRSQVKVSSKVLKLARTVQKGGA